MCNKHYLFFILLRFLTRSRLASCFVFNRRHRIAGVETSEREFGRKGNGVVLVCLVTNPTSFVLATCTSVVRGGVCGEERVFNVIDFPFCYCTRQRILAGFCADDKNSQSCSSLNGCCCHLGFRHASDNTHIHTKVSFFVNFFLLSVKAKQETNQTSNSGYLPFVPNLSLCGGF